MKSQPMTVEEFIFVMDRNPSIYPHYDALSDEQKRIMAHLNICTGTAETFFDDQGRVFGVGGIRFVGMGEAWFITPPESRDMKLSLFREVSQQFKRIRDEKNLWRVFSESHISENFLRHLGFEKQEGIHVWNRS